MKVLVIGANGNVGRHIVDKLQESQHEPVAMVRDSDQIPAFESKGVKTVLGNLENGFESAFYGVEAVIFAAGSGPDTGADKTILVDQEGAIKAVDHAKHYGVQRFIMLSSMAADRPQIGPGGMRHYLYAKHRADEYLKASGLNYTILRPGGLTDEPGSGKVELAAHLKEFGQISREDAAEALVYLLSVPRAENKSFDVLQGTQPLQEFLAH
ncbi:SDR family oxidoreductase [Halobacillus salinarum]|uniref:SDR family oxidoreductase n=1 Tax=Halobacillus salinarum TaxID=2932257 RepID=A0ABY4EK63_9BACI|nr:SDR family oxidoreductase [Halobacillus salinarum]UOQ44360.1 SDR family oxidoreductase [Halobacillus salinarum]